MWWFVADPTFWTAVGSTAGAIALPLAGISIFQSGKANKLSHQVDRRMVEIEEARDSAAELNGRRAKVTASLIESGGTMMLRIENRGQAPALDVRVEVGGRSLAEFEWNIGDGPPRTWPIEVDPVAMACVYLRPDTHCLQLSPVVVTWEDGTGEPGRWTSDLA